MSVIDDDPQPNDQPDDEAAPSSLEVVRHEERLRHHLVDEVTGGVRIGKRIVSQEQTITVVRRREELVVEDLAPDQLGQDGSGRAERAGREGGDVPGADGGPVLDLVLYEEVVETVVRVVPVERVRVFRDAVVSQVVVEESLAHEEVELDSSRGPVPRAAR